MVDERSNDEEEEKKISDRDLPLSFNEDTHLESIEGLNNVNQTWRMKDRMKTVSVALVLCLNVGVDPPDVVKTQPCARLECWIDPLTMSPAKALETIGNALQKQYERWQPRARYKQSLDPTAEEVKKLCTSLRRNAKEERVLFHYNGHGVPKPTTNGEIWVFNRTYTQYIPLSIYDLQTWMGAPSIYVYDCSNAGIIVDSFKQFALQHESEFEMAGGGSRGSPVPPSFRNCIQLAACGNNQVLPMNPELPADLFTACLTTPIKVALRWFLMRSNSKLVPQVTLEMLDKIPGQITDRRTMMGELNWVFTAVTDTIAWNTLPRDLFQRLFRQDLLVASLFRNFLLAERILRSHDCTPVSHPELPPTYQHPMWASWDLALDLSLGQLPKVHLYKEPFEPLPFFEEQLTAFDVWLQLGSERRNPPEQLPIVLQVLLSQIHRMKALELLWRFLDLGPWAVNLALSVGIFPYVLKLLQSSAKELRPLLVFIWSKILAVDNELGIEAAEELRKNCAWGTKLLHLTCQSDLVRDNGHKYFLGILQDPTISSKSRAEATFVLASIVHGFKGGQETALQGSLVSLCLLQITDKNPRLRQWVAICLGRLWDHYEKARWTGVRDIAHEKLYTLLSDPVPEVRAAAVYALGTFINSVTERTDHANNIDHSIVMTIVAFINGEMSCLVRKELVACLQWVVLAFEHTFINVVMQETYVPPAYEATLIAGIRRIGSRDRLGVMSPSSNLNSSGMDQVDSAEKLKRVASSSAISSIGGGHTGSWGTLPGSSYGSVYMKMWAALCKLEHDPHPEVAKMCKTVTSYIRNHVKEMQRDTSERLSASMSLPPSPNRGSYLAESPPTLHPTSDLQRFAARSAMANRSRRPNTISEDQEGEPLKARKALVETQFVAWSCKKYAQSTCKPSPFSDYESKEHYEREWRYIRNNGIRKESTEEQRRAPTSRVETQVFSTRCAAPPTILQFHPFDQRIVVGYKDTFGIWDWGTGAKLMYCQVKSAKQSINRLTSVEWINGFDQALLMVGSEDGSVRIYKPNGLVQKSREPSLVSAWQAHNDFILPSTNNKTSPSGLLLAWEQWTQTVITAGDTRVFRFWDTERESKAFEISTGVDCSVTCLDSTYASVSYEKEPLQVPMDDSEDEGISFSSGKSKRANWENRKTSHRNKRMGLVVGGFQNGSVRVYDRRCSSNDARVNIWMDHTSPVLGVLLRDNKIVSASAADGVRIYDIRTNNTLHANTAFGNITAFASHRNADTYACATPRDISVYNWSGQVLNSLRFYEGFMGYRIGPVNCLGYHPHKVALAAGTQDCTISVYCLEQHRR